MKKYLACFLFFGGVFFLANLISILQKGNVEAEKYQVMWILLHNLAYLGLNMLC